MMAEFPVIAVIGIDTNIGKTVATGLLGRYLLGQGKRVISQKLVQTGCTGLAEDIIVHRNLMGQELQPEDYQGLTCPYVFAKACSPHLAASLAGQEIDLAVIRQATRTLTVQYEQVLLEGAGGLLVPLTEKLTFLDYLEQEAYPLIVVSTPRLGSINHTLSVLELARNRGLTVLGIIYNRYQESDPVIAEDSAQVFSSYLKRYGFHDCVIDLFGLEEYDQQERKLDFSPLFRCRS
ncbi:MAG: dethiobiotin synthase [Proteobacteria bacterium]|jgi:dethiobiotin synthetase|nr:ATP-dependent dethiobiotin synthetase BioD [Desulfocapsa sp.]MBU3944805.1 dethiobiotin synthase [Pseudomonadota bacterium]MBU3984781.1 dethiobiotin synthase [Pseudomonadota bacterium]MBU4029404.1 dethiobiotin synthase [Pseudomonadota bacterium]MBU4041345.1 dethiobiotin synthase [Pseudomonadota bacterium]